MGSARSFVVFCPKLGGGGAEKVLIGYANFLCSSGYRVTLISLEDGPYRELLEKNVRVIIVKTRLRYSFFQLYKLLRRIEFSAIITGLPGPNFIMSMLGQVLRKDLIISLHNNYSVPASVEESALGRLTIPLNYVSIFLAKRVIAVSEGVSASHQSPFVNSKKIFVVPNSVDLPSVPALNKSRQFILAVGRLTYQKGFDRLILAYSQLAANERLPLKIVGSGEQQTSLEEQISNLGLINDVEIIPFQKDITKYYELAKVFVLSSRWEGFGNVIVEALSCGTPVVAFDIPSGPAEILADNEYSILVEDGNLTDLARGMARLSQINCRPEDVVSTSERFQRDEVKDTFLKAIDGI